MDLEKRVKILEEQIAEMATRIKEFENVMTFAFGIISDGGRPKKK